MTTPAPQEPLRLTLRVGEQTELALDTVATAGYRWEHRLEGPEGTLAVSRGPGPAAGDEPVGRGRPQHLRLEARQEGRVTVHLEQRRPWERTGPPRASRRVEVLVVRAD